MKIKNKENNAKNNYKNRKEKEKDKRKKIDNIKKRQNKKVREKTIK